jgi:hypothetical protein
MLSHADKKRFTKQQTLFAIHRHWIWAERIRVEYFERLQANPPKTSDMLEWFLTGEAMYECLWFGLLFVVCEGLKDAGLRVPKAQSDINTIYKDLGHFRNALFHIQGDYFSPKWFDVWDNHATRIKIGKVHKQIGEWLAVQIRPAQS